MKKKLAKIVFYGNERIATGVATKAPTLSRLIEAGYTVAAVIVNHHESEGRKKSLLEIEAVAENNNIPLFSPAKLSDIKDYLIGLNAEIGVLVAYGRIIPEDIINIFPKGIINIHPSDLPKHRGPSPIESTILEADKQTAVCLMSLVKEMDAGPLYAKREIVLTGEESKQELADKWLDIGSKTLIQVLPTVLNDDLKPINQSVESISYDQKIAKNNSIVDWKKSAIQIEKEIRAYRNWPKSIAKIGKIDAILTGATARDNQDDTSSIGKVTYNKTSGVLEVQCGAGILIISRLQPLGKSEMDAKSFYNGYKEKI